MSRDPIVGTTSLASARAHLSAIVRSVHYTGQRMVISRNGEPAAILISPDDLASLEETLEVLSDASVMGYLGEARAEIDAGTTVDLTELHRR
ncbi:type II toxin-antitoxin system Phd/YefM family antitoxin [Cellulomonas sp. ATA003]|uniref:type II toxin-antitoxin system Phd/YefM family antitoxin n=1 Tax=Cellulomonas sp. ATA003 TaxID=3073064 RepID=UPI002873C1E9|nr:type II toxin-antitoxin system Phd/YefM family antitoxin [Cellulomonas sp. ATA003]WNB87437.1 type II toxin-antitoxin system Phd/YefM family antitoxin [Cellulomonas sp. ATA003]